MSKSSQQPVQNVPAVLCVRMVPMWSAVFFDFDGVLVDSLAFHVVHVQKEEGIAMTPEQMRALHTVNFHNAVASDPSLRHIDWVRYHQRVADAEAHQAIHPLAAATVRDLYTHGRRLYVVSSGATANIRNFLEIHGLLGYFVGVFGYEQGLSKKEKFLHIAARDKIRLDKAVFVTDTVGDVCEGREAGVSTIAVTFGFHTRDVLQAAQPAHVCDSWEEVRSVLRI